ncbi:MAG: hypothetical protein GY705_25130 [Bacteroidetes bacterium]|nr:hypothetical protein [Bacteroidota bacterium]
MLFKVKRTDQDYETLSAVVGCTKPSELRKLIEVFSLHNKLNLFIIFEIDAKHEKITNFQQVPDRINIYGNQKVLFKHIADTTQGFQNAEIVNKVNDPLLQLISDHFKEPIGLLYLVPFPMDKDHYGLCLAAHSVGYKTAKLSYTTLHLFSTQLAMKMKTIKNSRLIDKRLLAYKKTVAEAKRTMQSPDERLDIDLIINSMQEALPEECKCSVLWLYNKDQFESGKELLLRYLSTVKNDEIKPFYLDVNDSLTGLAIKHKKQFYYDDVQNEQMFKGVSFARKLNLNKFIVYPLFDSKKIPIGAFNFYFDDNFVISDSFSNALSFNIQAFELVLEACEMQEKLVTLNSIVSFYKKADGVSTENQFFEKIVASLKDGGLIGIEGASIFITVPRLKKLQLVATTGVEGPWKIGDNAYAFGEGLTGKVIDRGHSIIENDLGKLKERQNGKVLETTKNPGKSWIGTPIKDITTNEMLGVIRCVNKQKKGNWPFSIFTILDQRALEFIAFISAQFIQNLRIVKRTQKALQLKEEVLIQQREFNRSITHEINIPVNSILGRLELLESYYNDSSIARQRINLLFDDIRVECSHIEMVSRSYSLSKPIFERINFIKDIVVRVKYVLARLCKNKHITIHYDMVFEGLEKRVRDYRLDKNRMLQVMYNLVNNAYKYSYENKDIEILITVKFDLTLEVRVSNHGIGIPEKSREAVFDQYFRTEKAKRYNPSGTGMGLYYCKKIIEEDHKGKIWLQQLDNPTIFTFSLPPELMI